jgi:SPP1 family predicted phage head-tail adaptor
MKGFSAMRAGTLDIRIALQRKSATYSSSGEPVEGWSTLAERWADAKPVQGAERNAAQQWVAREQTQFTLRWSSEVNDFSPVDRVVFPAEDVAVSPLPSRSVYDVMAVHQPDRNETIVIMAARRVG